MFSFFKKTPRTTAVADFGFLGVDMHSHVLPGIDDGSPDVATSLQLIRGLQEMGYQKLIATPHIYRDLYPNNTETIRQALATLQTALQASDLTVEVSAAAEYFLDDHFEELLRQKQLLTFGRNYLLVEMSFMAPYAKLHETVFQLCSQGYRPILAHPERYPYLGQTPELFENIRNYGCKLQVNTLSLAGYYGRPAQKAARWLLDRQLVDLLGTDLHHDRHEQQLRLLLRDARLMDQLNNYPFLNKSLLNDTPQ